MKKLESCWVCGGKVETLEATRTSFHGRCLKCGRELTMTPDYSLNVWFAVAVVVAWIVIWALRELV